jgi:hypothetical protein
LRKAGLGKIFKRQARDMTAGGPFITKLREDWKSAFATPAFRFLAVAGARDQFVPEDSSLAPFDKGVQAYVDGNHLEIVKPASAGTDNVVLVVNILAGAAEAAAPEPEFTERTIVRTALGIERRQGTLKAIEFLTGFPMDDTDIMGALAGRYKRLWLCDPELQGAAGQRACDLYHDAYNRADAASVHHQGYYHAINVAFMLLAMFNDREKAKTFARYALEHCAKAAPDMWRTATEGEALLHLDAPDEAVKRYVQALRYQPDPQQHESMHQQAVWTARLLDDEITEARLQALFTTGIEEMASAAAL